MSAETVAFLQMLPMFRTVNRATLEKLAAASRFRSFEERQAVFHEGEACRGFFAVRAGSVRLYRLSPEGRQQVMHTIRPGQSFAEAALLNIGIYPANAEAAETPTEVLEVKGEAFLQLFRSDEQLAGAMIGSLSSWLLRMVERVEELTIASAGARLARHLLKLPAHGPQDRLVIDLPMSKKDLAHHLAITPETLSRLLRRWQDRGVIESDRKSVIVTDTRVLLAIADGDDGADS